jgi:hypothetical protein
MTDTDTLFKEVREQAPHVPGDPILAYKFIRCARSLTQDRQLVLSRKSCNCRAGGRLFPRPLCGRRTGLPCLGDAAALLAQDVGVVGELVLEGELLAGVLARVVEFCSPYGQRAQCLGLRVVGPPLVLERFEVTGVAAVQCDDRAPHLLAPVGVAAVGLKPRRALAALAADEHRGGSERADLAVLGGERNAVADDLPGER